MEKAITRKETYLQAVASGDKSDLPNPITREEKLLYEIALRGGGGSGRDGLSAYDIAVLEGFQGTKAEWLASLKGADGNGFETMTKDEMLAVLRGGELS